jgi:Tfp pilus assembly protein PilF
VSRFKVFKVVCVLGVALSSQAQVSPSEADRAIAAAYTARTAGDYATAVTLLRRGLAERDDVRARTLLAETLAWQKQFDESEREYRRALSEAPGSREVLLGLGRVLMWRGSYPEARRTFGQILAREPKDIDALEGAATVAYWTGDFRTAFRLFSSVVTLDAQRSYARDVLRSIAQAAVATSRITIEALNDDQPYRWLHSEARHSWFTDPLTRIDVNAGSYLLEANQEHLRKHAELLSIGADVPLPTRRMSLGAMAGLVRFPDGVSRPIGAASLRYQLSPQWIARAGFSQRELLFAASSVHTHTFMQTANLSVELNEPQKTLAAIDLEGRRYSDGNHGRSGSAYVLHSIAAKGRWRLWGGASAAYRDTQTDRFEIESFSSTRSASGGEFLYTYQGEYDPYWTPRREREAKLITAMDLTLQRGVRLRAQIDAGIAKDSATGFGPATGPTPLPPSTFRFEFDRTYHPIRIGFVVGAPISDTLMLESRYDLNVTAFYRAKSFALTLVRRH